MVVDRRNTYYDCNIHHLEAGVVSLNHAIRSAFYLHGGFL